MNCSLFSYALYQISRGEDDITVEEEEELSNDEIVARKILSTAELQHVKLNGKLINAIRTQVIKIRKISADARKSGGKMFERLKTKWLNNPYMLKVYFFECDSKLLKRENVELADQLKEEKRKDRTVK